MDNLIHPGLKMSRRLLSHSVMPRYSHKLTAVQMNNRLSVALDNALAVRMKRSSEMQKHSLRSDADFKNNLSVNEHYSKSEKNGKRLGQLYNEKAYLESLFAMEEMRQIYLMKLSKGLGTKRFVNHFWIESINSRFARTSKAVRMIIYDELERIHNLIIYKTEQAFLDMLELRLSTSFVKLPEKHRRIKGQLFYNCCRKIKSLWKMFEEKKYRTVVMHGTHLLNMVMLSSEDKWAPLFSQAEVELNFLLAKCMIELRRFNEAIELLDLCIELARIRNYPVYEDLYLETTAELYIKKGNFEKAVNLWKLRYNNADNKIDMARINYEISVCYYCEGKFNDAIEYANRCITYANLTSDHWTLRGYLVIAAANSCVCLNSPFDENNVKSCCDSLVNALRQASKTKDVFQISCIFSIIRIFFKTIKSEHHGVLEEFFPKELYLFLHKETFEKERFTSRLIREEFAGR